MNRAAFNSLPSDWQDWIVGNLARSCEAESVADILIREGHFDPAVVRTAIEEASNGRVKLTPAPLPVMPDIDTSSNCIHACDRVIDVLLTVNSPRVVLLGNVVSDEEAAALAAYCQPRLERSPVVNDDDGSVQKHQSRTSRGAFIQRMETELVARIETRLAKLANWPVERAEGLQIQHYESTNEYRPHFDWFDPDLPGPQKHMEHGGQRLATFVIYLSGVESGGATAFPELGLEVWPKMGNAIFFQNTNGEHVPDRRTLHAGTPVVRGVKTIANKWLRARNY